MSVHSGMILLNIFGVRLKGRISSGLQGTSAITFTIEKKSG